MDLCERAMWGAAASNTHTRAKSPLFSSKSALSNGLIYGRVNTTLLMGPERSQGSLGPSWCLPTMSSSSQRLTTDVLPNGTLAERKAPRSPSSQIPRLPTGNLAQLPDMEVPRSPGPHHAMSLEAKAAPDFGGQSGVQGSLYPSSKQLSAVPGGSWDEDLCRRL